MNTNMNLNLDLSSAGVAEEDIRSRRQDAQDALDTLLKGEMDFTGWVKYPLTMPDDLLKKIKSMATTIQEHCGTFLVLGVGGSFMGAKAVIDALVPEHGKFPSVVFAGYNFSGRYLQELIEKIREDRLCVCLISKSGTTTETLATYGIIKELMEEKYGTHEAAARTYVITEDVPNPMRKEAEENGSPLLDIPLDIGGRYSVLTAVGLLPIAVSGIDIENLLAGAKVIADGISRKDFISAGNMDYAIVRQLLYEAGKSVEIYSFFYPYLEYLGEWLKQLFGESEGKEAKGLFPASLQFTRDLHSMGQFLQEGSHCFLETFITAEKYPGDVLIPSSAPAPLGGQTMNEINRCAEVGVMAAHRDSGNPIVSISVPEINPYTMGQLLYFFQTTCAVTALMSGVNPFDQPGVEAYKKEMKAEIAALSQ